MSLFDTSTMAEGYAVWRPPVHPHVAAIVGAYLETAGPLARAVDVGCGAGRSTGPLAELARQVVGLDPSTRMLRKAAGVAPGARFVAARAEGLPFRSGSIDLVAAGGSLNWARLDLFVAEAARVLAPAGTLVVYDFGPGRDFVDSAHLMRWFTEFERRYPAPPCAVIDPAALGELAGDGFRLVHARRFEVDLPIEPAFYLEYVLTETGVADAIRRGETEPEIRSWCRETLGRFYRGTRDVRFRGYVAMLMASSTAR